MKIYLDRLKSRKWFLVLLTLFLWDSIRLFAYRSPAIYTAKAIFHPQLNQNNTNANIANNPLSLILGGGIEGVESGFMMGILKSRNISEALSQDTVTIKDKQVLLADEILYSMPTSLNPLVWIQGIIMSNKEPTLEQKIIAAGRIVRQSTNLENTPEGFISLKFTSFDKNLATLISEKLIDELEIYYREQKTEKARQNLAFLLPGLILLKWN